MAIFPALNRVQGDDTQTDSGLSTVFAPDGNQYGQSFYGDEYIIFTPRFIGLNEAAKTNLQNFWVTNKLLAFDYYYEDRGFSTVIYECRFLGSAPRFVRTEALSINPPFQLYEAYVQFRGKVKP